MYVVVADVTERVEELKLMLLAWPVTPETPDVPLLPLVPTAPSIPLVPLVPLAPGAPFKETCHTLYAPDPTVSVGTAKSNCPVPGLYAVIVDSW